MRRCSSNPHGTCSGTLNSLHRVWHAALPKCATVRAILTELALNLNSYTMGTNARDVQRASRWMRRMVVTVTSPDEALPTDGSGAGPLRKHLLLHHHHQPTKRRSTSFFGRWRLLGCYPIAWVLSERRRADAGQVACNICTNSNWANTKFWMSGLQQCLGRVEQILLILP